MAEPITLAVIGAVALTEGIKFLYGQAGELLKRRRERKAAADAKKEAEPATETEPVEVNLPEVFAGQLTTPQIHYDDLEQVADELSNTRKELSEYVDSVREVDPKDETLLAQVDALRQMLEAVYQQRITFKGENRPPSGPIVEGRVKAGEVAGLAAGVRARKIKAGTVRGIGEADTVKEGGVLGGVVADEIG